MVNIWIESLQSPDRSEIQTPGASAYQWQAMFACQVKVKDHDAWSKLKWGFNAGALFDEAIERQRLFLESQFALNNETRHEEPNIRALALRYINTGQGLLVSILGKVSAKTQEDAIILANYYFCEIIASFPYDYLLSPATSREEFHRISGSDLLLSRDNVDVVQIKRSETLIPLNKKFPYFQGLWQSGGRSYEQIWRSINASTPGTLLNILLRPTVLYDSDLEAYLALSQDLSKYHPEDHVQKIFNPHKEWHDNFIKRRLVPWKKFFYLQFHIVSPNMLPENLVRNVGTVLTQNSQSLSIPGYQVVKPPAKKNTEWSEKIYKMYLTSWGSRLPDPRLSEIADMEEVFSAVKLPYSPPGTESLRLHYQSIKAE